VAEIPIGLQRVAVYLRKSRADLEAEARGEGETLAKHKKALLELATRNKLNIVSIREEIASGERIDDRPEMQRLLKEVEAGEYEAVLCMDLDRLGRGDMIDQGRILAAFKRSSTLIITPRKVYNLADELDEEWSEIEAFLARRELKIIKKRLQQGRVMAVKEGKFIGARTPFGYDKGPDDILVPNKDAEIVRLIFSLYVYGENGKQMGSTKIAHRLNQMGIKSPIRGHAWDASSVLSILKNEVYIGRIQWKKSLRDRSKKIGHLRPREEWIDVQGRHQPIIEEPLFQAAQELRKKRSKVPTKKTPQNPLAGLVVCGKCGRKMVLQQGRKGKVKMIKCVNPVCNNKSSLFHFLEERLLTAIRQELAQLEIKTEILEQEIAATHTAPLLSSTLLKKLENQLAELHRQKSRIQDFLEQGIYDVPTYLRRSEIISERIKTVEQLIVQVQQELSTSEEEKKAVPQTIPTIQHILDAYHATEDVVKKNMLLKSIIKKAVYLKEKDARLDNFFLDVYLLV